MPDDFDCCAVPEYIGKHTSTVHTFDRINVTISFAVLYKLYERVAQRRVEFGHRDSHDYGPAHYAPEV